MELGGRAARPSDRCYTNVGEDIAMRRLALAVVMLVALTTPMLGCAKAWKREPSLSPIKQSEHCVDIRATPDGDSNLMPALLYRGNTN